MTRKSASVVSRIGSAVVSVIQTASVGKTHREVLVLVQQPQHRFDFIVQCERDQQRSATKQCAECGGSRPSNQVKRFRHNGFAGVPFRRKTRRDRFGPSMMRIATAEQGNQKAGINRNVSGHTRSSSNSASFFRSGPTANHRLIRSGPRSRIAWTIGFQALSCQPEPFPNDIGPRTSARSRLGFNSGGERFRKSHCDGLHGRMYTP